MRVDIVTPERQLVSAEADAVQIPGMEGDMTVMGDHAPLVTSLRPGFVAVEGGEAPGEFLVTGGFAEISSEGASILAEQAVPRAEASREMLEEILEAAKADAEKVAEEGRIMAELRVNDVTELLRQIG